LSVDAAFFCLFDAELPMTIICSIVSVIFVADYGLHVDYRTSSGPTPTLQYYDTRYRLLGYAGRVV
jgi:hypothetical protein